MANGQGWFIALLTLDAIVLGLSAWSITFGNIYSLVFGIILVVLAVTAIVGVSLRKQKYSRVNLALFILYLVLNIAAMVLAFAFKAWTTGFIQIAFVVFAVICIVVNQKANQHIEWKE